MDQILQKHRSLWAQADFREAALFSLLFLTAGLAAIMTSRAYLMHSAVHAVSPPDFFLDLLPVMGMENILVWGVPLLIACIIVALVLHPERIPFALNVLGLLFLFRAFFIILTPMGIRPDQIPMTGTGLLQSIAYGSNDFFFSGHVSFPFLMGLVFLRDKWISAVFFLFAGIFAVGVLLAHTHYSIDVFAVPLIVPSIKRFGAYLFRDDWVVVSLPARSRRSLVFS